MGNKNYNEGVIEICKRVLEDNKTPIRNIKLSMTFKEMNFDSLMYIYLITLVEDKYEVTIKDEFFEHFGDKSLLELVKQIEQEQC